MTVTMESSLLMFLVALVASQMRVSIAQIQVCDHADYDVDTLKMQPKWTASIHNTDSCGGRNPNSQCTVEFTVCGALPHDGKCNRGKRGTAFCQEVRPTDGDTRYYDTGKMDLIVNEANGSTGFQFIYRNGSTTDSCADDTTSTLVFFQCDPTAQWDLADRDVTRFVDYFVVDPEDGCLFLMALNYSGACVSQKPNSHDLCHLDNYDLETLSQPMAWLATVSSSKCYGVLVPEATCTLLFSFCKHLPLGQCYDSTFCQTGSTKPTSFGSYNNDIKVIKNDNQEGFTITYTNGTITTQCPAGLFSTLVFTCDPNAVWDVSTDQGYTDITKYILAGPSFSDCEYVVKFRYSGACFSDSPSVSSSSSWSTKIFPTAISTNIFPTDIFPTAISTDIFPTDIFPTTISTNIFPTDIFPTAVSTNMFPTDIFPTTISTNIFPTAISTDIFPTALPTDTAISMNTLPTAAISTEISPTITSTETVTSTGVSPSVTSTINPTVAPQSVSNVKWIVIPIVLVIAVGVIVLVVTVAAVLFKKRRKGTKNSNINYEILQDKEDDINT